MTGASDRPPALLDTNVLVYAYDRSEGWKHGRVIEGVRFCNPFAEDGSLGERVSPERPPEGESAQ